MVDCFQSIAPNLSSSKKKEVSNLQKFEYEAGKLSAFKEICCSVFWQVMQCMRSGAFLTCKVSDLAVTPAAVEGTGKGGPASY